MSVSTDPNEKDLVTLKEVCQHSTVRSVGEKHPLFVADSSSLSFSLQMQLLKTDSVAHKPEKPAPVPVSGPAAAPPAPSSVLAPATVPAKSASLPPSASQAPQAAPAAPEVGLKEHGLPLVEGTGGKEEYGYIVTNRRSATRSRPKCVMKSLKSRQHGG